MNIEFGCAYLSYLLAYFNGVTDKAIAAYNAGMGNVDVWAQEDDLLHNAITFPETQAYPCACPWRKRATKSSIRHL